MGGSQKSRVFQIAIDGPVAAGKSTVAKLVAQRLGFVYVDTGAMYRAVALEAKKRGIDWQDEEAVTELMSTLELELDKPNEEENDGRLVTILLDEKDVSNEIRTSEMGEGASVVSQYGGVREVLVAMQQIIASGENVVMEGRDIGVRVLPEANLKIYMDADVDERAKRKRQYLKKMGIKQTIREVKEDLMKRDRREMTRKIDPLKPVKGAWKFDTTGMKIEEVVGAIVERVKKKRSGRS